MISFKDHPLQSILFLTFLALCVALLPRVAHAVVWPEIRDGVVYIQVPPVSHAPATILINWEDAWISESQSDHIYLQNPDGTLQEKLVLDKTNTPGKKRLELNSPGTYRLEITGASFRSVTVTIPDEVKSMFEPVKVHKSISLPKGQNIYFNVPENAPFAFGCKNYGKIKTFILTPTIIGSRLEISCKKHKIYADFDHRDIPASPRKQTWKLHWQGKGKISFWLDEIPNLFAQSPNELFPLHYEDGASRFKIGQRVLGSMPSVGAALPFTAPPGKAYELINSWRLTSANHYVFTDYILEKGQNAVDFQSLYENRFSIPENNAIFAESGRKMVFDSTKGAEKAILTYLRDHKSSPGHTTYYSIGDEPNLNYPGFNEYSRTFGEIARRIKTHPDPKIRSTKLAAPQSSRFLNGPTRNGAEDRIGVDWAKKLISQYGEYIDAISWHQWLVRDLIDTDRYRESVESANSLRSIYRDKFTHNPALIIGQTNISSGASLSHYENDTFFAALWWTSVVIKSSLPGKLLQLIWFKAADDGLYNKGLVTVTGNTFTEKPVSKAMSFINLNAGKWVLELSGNHPELDLLATLSEDRTELKLLGVNKAPRNHLLSLDLGSKFTKANLQTYSQAGHTENSIAAGGPTLQLPIHGETIFSLAFQLGQE